MKLFGQLTNVMKPLAPLATKIKVNSPTVLLVSGGVCVVGAIVAAHHAGRKIDEVLDVHKAQVDNLKEIKEAGEYRENDEEGNEIVTEFTPEDYKKELTHTYISTAWDLTKLYGPVVVGGAGAIVCFVSGNRILAKRLAGMTAAYQIVQEKFMTYRGNVVKDLGVDADRKYLLGLDDTVKEKYYETAIDEKTGDVKQVGKAKSRDIDVVSDVKNWDMASPYAIRLTDCGDLTKDMQYNVMWLSNVEKMANDKFDWKGYLTLYEVYEALGCLNSLTTEAEKMSHQVGWVKGRGDGDIRFNLVMVPTVCGFKDGIAGNLSEVGLIDFNCIGTIWDKVA